jgi:hypothetical protein
MWCPKYTTTYFVLCSCTKPAIYCVVWHFCRKSLDFFLGSHFFYTWVMHELVPVVPCCKFLEQSLLYSCFMKVVVQEGILIYKQSSWLHLQLLRMLFRLDKLHIFQRHVHVSCNELCISFSEQLTFLKNCIFWKSEQSNWTCRSGCW